MTCSLQSYLDDNSTDLIADVLTDADGNAYSYATKAGRAIWATYRYAIMNTCGDDDGIKRWIQRGQDIAYNMDERYSQLFAAYEQFKSTGVLTDINIGQKQTAVTDGTVKNTGTVTNVSDDDRKITGTTEAIPQYSDASNGTWLTGRTGTATDGDLTDTRTDDTTAKTDATVTTTIEGTGGVLSNELIRRMKDGLFNPYLEYAREFATLFVPFWVDECGCW